MVSGFDLLLSSSTSLPFVELADAVGAALRARGHDARAVTDVIPPITDDRATVVIGPHDVYPHFGGTSSTEVTTSLARTILICCERPNAPSWDALVPLASQAGAVLHVSDAGVAAFSELGLPARRFHLSCNQLVESACDDRPVDVTFLGSFTPRRARVLAQAAEVLSERNCDIRLTEGLASGTEEVGNFVSGLAKQDLLTSSKVLLNIHPDRDATFEWPRAVDAFASGCVLVTEESVGMRPLVAGTHLLSGSVASLPLLVDLVLSEPERIRAIRDAAYEFAGTQFPLTRSVAVVEELAGHLPPSPPVARNFMARPGRALEQRSESPGDQDAVPAPDAEASPLLVQQNAVLKKLYFDLRLLRRQVAHLSHVVESPSAPLIELTATPEDGSAEPDVTVVVTVHNYARFVADALLSVLRSEDIAVELVVVDDASIDGSADVVRDLMEQHPNAAIRLIEQRVNTGVQRARNLAFDHARAPYAFVLDADNLVYPHGIAKLHRILVEDPQAAFSYGMIERFDAAGPTGVMGWEPWDPVLLASRNYIDAMAMVRVDAWRRVGGYVTDPLLELGWEDYDLWLSFAVAGLHGAHAREFVGRYRTHGVSSLAITTLDTADLMAKLRQRHAPFFEAIGGRAS